jgi:hypothetical protein
VVLAEEVGFADGFFGEVGVHGEAGRNEKERKG